MREEEEQQTVDEKARCRAVKCEVVRCGCEESANGWTDAKGGVVCDAVDGIRVGAFF